MNFFNRNQFDEEEAWRIEQEEQQANQEARMDKMSKRFDMRFNQKKSFVAQYAETRYWVGILSWIPQIVSVVAAFKGARVLLEWVPIPYFDYIVGAAALVGLEIAKRHWSDKFWDRFFGTKRIHLGAFSVNFSLFVISLLFSAYGFYFLVADNSKEAKLMGTSGDPEAVAIQDQLKQSKADLAAMIDDKSNYNHEGKFFYKLIPAKVAKEKEIAELTTTLREKHGIYNIQNTQIIQEWGIRTGFQKHIGISITIVAELIFELMMAFCSFYDFRRWLIERRILERKKAGGRQASPASAGQQQGNHAAPPHQGGQLPNGIPFPANAATLAPTPSAQLGDSPGPQPDTQPPPPPNIPGDSPYAPSGRTVVDPFGGRLRRPAVATSSYPVATEEPALPDVRAEMLVQALKSANSNIAAWNAKPDGKAKARNIQKYQAIYDEAASDLAQMGVSVEDVLKKRSA